MLQCLNHLRTDSSHEEPIYSAFGKKKGVTSSLLYVCKGGWGGIHLRTACNMVGRGGGF